MHELSLIQSIVKRLEALCRDEQADGIERVYVSIGDLCGISVAAFEAGLPLAVQDSALADTDWTLNRVPAKLICKACGVPSETDAFCLVCHQCGSRDVKLVAGTDLTIDRVDLK